MADEAKIKRLAEIQEQIKTLCEEGVQIADEQDVSFYLGDAPFTAQYGSGGMIYYPKGEGPFVDEEYGHELTTDYGDSVRGKWMASNSWGC